jgi:hypothetical protein
MHKHHLVGCGAGIALALTFVALTGASAGSVAVLVAALACPLGMGGAMWFLMGRRGKVDGGPHANSAAPTGPAHP